MTKLMLFVKKIYKIGSLRNIEIKDIIKAIGFRNQQLGRILLKETTKKPIVSYEDSSIFVDH